MATLVLTTIGSIVGGPIGGAIGAIIGQGIDQRLLAPKGRQGPRLGDLTVQTSTYGSQIPKLFGTLRVAGTVIWATDLKETRDSSGGGKGRPKTIDYSYSASFAVALSGRAIGAVHRIWADGKLLRGAADDWKSDLGAFRVYLGSEAQPVDPLVASAEGAGGTPAYRGTAYALFEDLQLADFGNRIPSLTFEVEADAAAVSLPMIAGALSDGAVTGDMAAAVSGYAASGDSVRGAIEALAALAPLSLHDDGTVLQLTDGGAITVLDQDALGAAVGDKRARIEIERQAAGTLPDEVAVSYYEPARDYQAGLQRARRGGPGRRVDSVDLPAALAAGEAKAVAERRLARSWAERVRATIALPPRQLPLRPGGLVGLPGRAETFRIASWTLEHMALQLGLTAVSPGSAASAASAGRPTAEADAPAGTTVIALLDLPPLDDAPASTPRLWIAAAGTDTGWRRAQLLASIDGGTSYLALGTTRPGAIIGTALDVLGPGDPVLFDARSSIDVELANPDLWLESRSDDALMSGSNAAMLGDELIQFGSAQAIGPARFRLTRLLRGRRGSEWAIGDHAAGDRFVMIDAATLLPLDVPIASLGGGVRVLATGVGDLAAVAADAVINGWALRPPPPVHLSAVRLADDTIRIGWVRRSRLGWNWLDGGDAPLGEESERYRLTVTPDAGTARTIETMAAGYDYSPAEQLADGAAAATAIGVAVVQLGALAPSQPAATRHFPL